MNVRETLQDLKQRLFIYKSLFPFTAMYRFKTLREYTVVTLLIIDSVLSVLVSCQLHCLNTNCRFSNIAVPKVVE